MDHKTPRSQPTVAELTAARETLAKLARSIEMGEVKDAVTKRTPRDVKKPLDTGLMETAERLRDELSRCTAIKDDDTLNESADQRAENIRKATQLRSAHVLMSGVCALLEDYS
jgi:hypothetical protein